MRAPSSWWLSLLLLVLVLVLPLPPGQADSPPWQAVCLSSREKACVFVCVDG
jgi:hypothetical protein